MLCFFICIFAATTQALRTEQIMKNPYTSLWLLLTAAFATIVILSFRTIRIGDIELAKADVVEQLTKRTDKELLPEAPAAAVHTDTTLTEDNTIVTDTLPQRILIFGDSMLEGLSPRLAAYAKQNGHELYSVIWYSSTSEIWGKSTKVAEYIKQFNPTYIFVSLGANEMFVRDIIEKRDKFVKNILAQIGDIPYVWIGPPNWKEDTGINELIKKNVPADRFFVSNGMTFERSSDKVHPTRKSAAVWMDSVVNWMAGNSKKFIRLEKPEKASDKANRTIVLQPAK